jgi:hypothetical protein
MYRLYTLAGLLGLVVVLSTASLKAEDDKKDAKPKNIGEIMKKAHLGEGALRAAVIKSLKTNDYETAGKTAKAWVAISGHLGSFNPPKGDKESWKKLTKTYAATVKDLEKAIGKKDGKEAMAVIKKINTSCGKCHNAHRAEDE